MRLLTVVEHVRPDFTYIPILYALCAILLHYMNDEDAFACVMTILCHSQKFLIQTDIAGDPIFYNALFSRRLLLLQHKTFSLLKTLLNTNDDQLVIAAFNDWNAWLFRDLPYSHLVRVVDCFLFEGLKVLFRCTLALMMLWNRDRCIFAFLLFVAFNIRNLKMSHIRRIQERHEMKLRRRTSLKSSRFHSCDLNDLHSVRAKFQAALLISWIPSRYHIYPPKKLFSMQQDGVSFTTLWMKIENYCPSILLIKTSKSEMFGAYCSEAWSYRRRCANNCFFGTGECFLFRITPEPCHYPWIGLKKSPVTHGEELFQLAQPSVLIVGGGDLSYKENFSNGIHAPNSYCLVYLPDPVIIGSVDVMDIIGFITILWFSVSSIYLLLRFHCSSVR
ncbi:unnamed protein product [Soboliphyme baturini]|uniref:Rab-GAP TBC domain-containing protein n=1 Tax=Soboliphyme baturini TaxID=241478 RepID=A0A183IEM7_9BILA|nr:unnamed protein product [Soboliphyme baturini]